MVMPLVPGWGGGGVGGYAIPSQKDAVVFIG